LLRFGHARLAALRASEVWDDSGFSQRPDQNQGNPTGCGIAGGRYIDTDEESEQSKYVNLKSLDPIRQELNEVKL
jgi:hypothetical protein